MPKSNRRNRRQELLTAFARLVNEGGDRAATLDAVAAAADVSKGGLLYHFPSKDALITGLCERFVELVDDDLDTMRARNTAPSAWYLGTSPDFESDLEVAMSALLRLAPGYEATIRPVLVAARERWFASIAEELGDENLATVIVLLGDGMAYNAELEGGQTSRFVSADTVAYVTKLIARARARE